MAPSHTEEDAHLHLPLVSPACSQSPSSPSPKSVIKVSLSAFSLFLLLAFLALTKPSFLPPVFTSFTSESRLQLGSQHGSSSNSVIKPKSLYRPCPSPVSASGSHSKLESTRKSAVGTPSQKGLPRGDDAPFYQPKSTEPTKFSGAVRVNSPWNSSALNSLRTAFHFQPESNWMNDPDAPLFYNGWYHLFYQYNPNSAYWGLISWGHAVSVDLIHWLYLDLAMEPDQWYDSRGVWTGSATFLTDGSPVVIYTGSTNESVQVQNVAYPADISDFLLRNWTKYAGNPVLEPPAGILATDFRDPTTAWLGTDGLWRLAIGSKMDQKGIAIIYQSSDFINWTMQEHYLHEVEGTGMWECLDFYPIYKSGSPSGVDTSTYGEDVKHVLKASMDDTKLDFYVIGTYNHQNQTFTSDDPSLDLGSGLRYDYGKFYASKSFYDTNEGRRILWGWINESDTLQDDIEKGWASLQALPRQVWFDNFTQTNLLQWPIDDVLDLRRARVSLDNTVLESGSIVQIPEGSGAQWDIELTFENPTSNYNGHHRTSVAEVYSCSETTAATEGYFGPFGILVLASDDIQEQTAIYFYFTNINGVWTAIVCNDQSRSTLATDVDKSIYGYLVPLLETETSLSLRVIVDHSIVETFAQGGRTCITSRVYPTIALDDEAKLFVFNNGTMPVTLQSLSAWKIAKVYMHAYASVQ